jgi:Na+-transporting methylmalonyl-CoA/oxaloacetate decarboxylase gamma subunit
MTPLAEGLRVSMIGLALVFLALGLLSLLLSVLQHGSHWIVEVQERRRRAVPAGESGGVHGRADEQLARVAAMAVALVQAQRSTPRDPSLGELLHHAGSIVRVRSEMSHVWVEEHVTQWPRTRRFN